MLRRTLAVVFGQFALTTCFSGAVLTGCGASNPSPSSVSAKGPAVVAQAHSLFPGDLDLVARIDWKKVRAQGLAEPATGYLHAFGVPSPFVLALQPCLALASSLWVGMRIRNQGSDGDVVIALDELEDGKVRAACVLEGFHDEGMRRGALVQVPLRTKTLPDEPAIAIRTERGLVLGGLAQVDALQRILRDGPDERRLEPSSDSVVSIEAMVEHSRIPLELRNKAPSLFAATKGLERAKLSLEIGASVHVKGVFAYASEVDANEAGKLLAKVREAIMSSDRPEYRDAARSSHANLIDSTIRFRFDIPR